MAQHLKLHALTGNSDHDTTGLVNGQILYVQNPTNGVQSTGIYTNGSGGLTATTASITTLSAGTMISGSTNLYNIFLTAGQLSGTTVTAGSNVSVSNLGNNYTVSVVPSPSFNNLTASGATSLQTLSATTMISGSTNLYQIFAPFGSGVQSVGATGNAQTGGTATNPVISIVQSPSFNNLTVSGTGNFTGILQSGGTNLGNIFVDGSGTTNKIPLWLNGVRTLTDSIITQSGTGVTVNGSVNILGDVTILGTATTINTQTIQSLDNNILLNYSGNHVSAIGGGITVLSGTPSGAPSIWATDANGAWSSNTAIITTAITVNGGNIAVTGGGAITSGGTNLYQIFATAGSGVQSVGANGNLSTGGTATNPTIILTDSPSFNNLTASGATSLQTLSATTMISGSTNLYQIFTTGLHTNVQPGTNITTGGTAQAPIINVVASPSFNSVTASGASSFTTLSATTIISGSTNINSLFVNGVVAGSNTTIGGSSTFPIVNVVASPSFNNLTVSGATSLQTLSATTMISGSTNLYQIFAPFGTVSGVESVGANGNLFTGGTAINPTINLTGSPSFNNLTVSGATSLATLSATTMISGSTNLYQIFAPFGQDATTASNGLTKSGNNITLGGSLTAATAVVLGGNALQLSGEGASSTTVAWSGAPYYTRLLVNGSGSQLKTTFGTAGNNFFLASDTMTMNFADGGTGNQMIMKFDGTNMFVTDNINSRGLEYVADYSPNFLSNSLVTKLYVSQAITGVTSGLTNTHVQPGSNITTGGTAANPTVNLVASPSINNLTVSGTTTAQGISGTTIYASQFFQMTPYTGANPTSPNNNDAWFHSAATGTITLNYRVGGVSYGVELA